MKAKANRPLKTLAPYTSIEEVKSRERDIFSQRVQQKIEEKVKWCGKERQRYGDATAAGILEEGRCVGLHDAEEIILRVIDEMNKEAEQRQGAKQ